MTASTLSTTLQRFLHFHSHPEPHILSPGSKIVLEVIFHKTTDMVSKPNPHLFRHETERYVVHLNPHFSRIQRHGAEILAKGNLSQYKRKIIEQPWPTVINPLHVSLMKKFKHETIGVHHGDVHLVLRLPREKSFCLWKYWSENRLVNEKPTNKAEI